LNFAGKLFPEFIWNKNKKKYYHGKPKLEDFEINYPLKQTNIAEG
jgi:hypothetical protein